MRKLVFGLMAFGTLAAFSPTPAAAFFDTYNYPYCITGGRDYPGGTRECSYPTYAACQAAASGRGVYCIANPFPTPYNSQTPRRSRRSLAPAY